MSKPKKKRIYTVEYPHCLSILDIFETTGVLVPAQKTEKKVHYTAEKST